MTGCRHRASALVAVASLMAGGMAPLAGAVAGTPAGPRTAVAAAPAPWSMDAVLTVVAGSGSGCPPAISCGTGCKATLQVSVCILSIKWTASVRVGGVQIGPSFRFQCYICECWYTYTSPYGHELFKRNTDGSCQGDFPGLILE